MLSNHAFPDGAVAANSRIKITKSDELVSVGDSSDDIIQVLVEFILDLIWVGYGRDVAADCIGWCGTSNV